MSAPSTGDVKAPKESSKVKKEKTSKKSKSEEVAEEPSALGDTVANEPVEPFKLTKTKREKKEKNSRKKKVEELGDENAAAVNDGTAASDGIPNGDTDAPLSKKRKASVLEIEVDVSLPEPPSKRALRLLKKGKPLPPSKSGAESSPEPETQKKKAEGEKRSEHGIWIGNMPFHISKAELQKFFVEHSDITDDMITRINMPGPNDKKSANKVEVPGRFKKVENNKGFAYVDFSTAEAVEKVIELSETLLSGRAVLIKNAKSFLGRPEKTKEEERKDAKPPNRRIFIGNLAFDTTQEQIQEHFSKCGTIGNIKIATFEDSGKCKGYGWIEFEDVESAISAVKGYVMIEEALPDASDSDSELNSDADVEVILTEKKKPKTKRRKWWINKIGHRLMKIEFAEDAQLRYKKRYGKGGTKGAAAEPREDAGATAGVNGDGEGKKWERDTQRVEKEKPEYMLPYGGPQLTGGIVKSTGKKVTF